MLFTRANIAKLAVMPCTAVLALPGAPAHGQAPSESGGALAASEGQPALFAGPGALLGRTLHLRGTLPSDGSRTVRLERLEASRWIPVAHAQTAADGTFLARWRTDILGDHAVRAVPAETSRGARTASAGPLARVTVFRPVRATWYGPGFFGRRTACGQTMSRSLRGVAHRTLPCGTNVEIYRAGRRTSAPVVDRGPYANGAHYDLTQATAREVGLAATETIGVLPRR